MNMLKKALPIILLTLVVLSPTVLAQANRQLTIAIRNADYDTFDPHVSNFTQSAYVFENIFDRLIYLDDKGNYEPWLATSWKPNKDATEWTLKLRRGVTFTDGTPFNAEAVKFNFDRMVNPATISKYAGPLLASYSGTKIVDEYTVEVSFKKPFVLFPEVLSSPFLGMVSPTAVKKYGKDFSKHLIGSGPFKFVSEVPHNSVVLERNPDYNWAPASFHKGPAYIEKLVYRFVEEDATRLSLLRTGEADIIDEVPSNQVAQLKANAAFKIAVAPKVGVARSLFLNTVEPPTNDINVRRAMNYAVNRKALEQAVFHGVYPLATQILTPGVRFYDPSLDNYYPYNPEKAKELLEEAGWTKINSDGYRVKDGKVLEIYHATFPGVVAQAPAEIVQAQLKKVGIKFDIHVMSGAAMMSGMAAPGSKFNSALVGTYDPDPGVILNSFFNSDAIGANNFSHYSNKKVDALLTQGLATTDDKERAKIYSEISRILLEDAVGVPLYTNVSVFGLRKNVSGFKFDDRALPQIFDVQVGQ